MKRSIVGLLLFIEAVVLAACSVVQCGSSTSRRSARMPRSEERGGMAARSEAEINPLLVYKSPTRQGGVLYSRFLPFCTIPPLRIMSSQQIHPAALAFVVGNKLKTENLR